MKTNIGVLVYVRKRGHYLMLHRNKKKDDMHEGLWVAPGGKREPNESIPDCARRELFEETGLTARSLKFLGFLHFPQAGNSPFGGEWVDFVFLCTRFTGTLLPAGPEGTLGWIPAQELHSLPMWEGDKVFTPFVLQGKRFDISLTYEEKRLVSYSVKDLH
ncbi:8-oxo-dGTP diphosphatase [Candidatus Mcinerneyibacteriota bacterium]|nr:8-oxo-dGTP diphosphatase [Candidatus Mcinerneyibacteriota bacterium]